MEGENGNIQRPRFEYLVNHMTDLMRDTGGYVEQINPAKLFSLTKELDDRLSSHEQIEEQSK